jgi:hypothetical protein
MVRLRNAVMTAALFGTGMTGCSFTHQGIAHYSIWHCDECDDFPTPGYGPGYSMMPGTYTGPPARESLESNVPPTSAPAPGSAAPAAPLVQPRPPLTPAPVVTPPPPPDAAPDQGADARPPAGIPLNLPAVGVTSAQPALPPLPSDPRERNSR